MSFGARLKELRNSAGLTQAQLAEKVGIQRESLARLEAGGHDPGWSTVKAICRALCVECTAFTDDDDGDGPGRGRPPKAKPGDASVGANNSRRQKASE